MVERRNFVRFKATKKVSNPTIVKFNTKDGSVSFKATKSVSKPTVVKFYAKKKK